MLVKVSSGEWVKRRAWSIDGDSVFVATERQYDGLIAGTTPLWPIAFPSRDVRLLIDEDLPRLIERTAKRLSYAAKDLSERYASHP